MLPGTAQQREHRVGSSRGRCERPTEAKARRAPSMGLQGWPGRRRLLGRYALPTVLTATRFDQIPSIHIFLFISYSPVLMMYKVWLR